MSADLSAQELVQLIRRVFRPGPDDRALALIADLPGGRLADNPDWRDRRGMAADWAAALDAAKADAGLERVTLAWYPNVGGNNADLPAACTPGAPGERLDHADDLAGRDALPFAELFDTHSLVLAPTELSATAPLKVAARVHAMRAATMPGFLASMVPALRIDYGEVNRRVDLLKELVDKALGAVIHFRAEGADHRLHLDLRHRTGHASGGLFPANGVAGNLPSGETYIVPYEGEIAQDPTRTAGTIPVQFGEEVVVYEVRGNRAVAVLSDGPESEREADYLRREPAYANIAELGLGVLGDFGLAPTGTILLDEKLGLHVAFGRSDHFGGQVGPGDFSSPDAVVHIDRVYIPEVQPKVEVVSLDLHLPEGERRVMCDGAWTGVF